MKTTRTYLKFPSANHPDRIIGRLSLLNREYLNSAGEQMTLLISLVKIVFQNGLKTISKIGLEKSIFYAFQNIKTILYGIARNIQGDTVKSHSTAYMKDEETSYGEIMEIFTKEAARVKEEFDNVIASVERERPTSRSANEKLENAVEKYCNQGSFNQIFPSILSTNLEQLATNLLECWKQVSPVTKILAEVAGRKLEETRCHVRLDISKSIRISTIECSLLNNKLDFVVEDRVKFGWIDEISGLCFVNWKMQNLEIVREEETSHICQKFDKTLLLNVITGGVKNFCHIKPFSIKQYTHIKLIQKIIKMKYPKKPIIVSYSDYKGDLKENDKLRFKSVDTLEIEPEKWEVPKLLDVIASFLGWEKNVLELYFLLIPDIGFYDFERPNIAMIQDDLCELCVEDIFKVEKMQVGGDRELKAVCKRIDELLCISENKKEFSSKESLKPFFFPKEEIRIGNGNEKKKIGIFSVFQDFREGFTVLSHNGPTAKAYRSLMYHSTVGSPHLLELSVANACCWNLDWAQLCLCSIHRQEAPKGTNKEWFNAAEKPKQSDCRFCRKRFEELENFKKQNLLDKVSGDWKKFDVIHIIAFGSVAKTSVDAMLDMNEIKNLGEVFYLPHLNAQPGTIPKQSLLLKKIMKVCSSISQSIDGKILDKEVARKCLALSNPSSWCPIVLERMIEEKAKVLLSISNKVVKEYKDEFFRLLPNGCDPDEIAADMKNEKSMRFNFGHCAKLVALLPFIKDENDKRKGENAIEKKERKKHLKEKELEIDHSKKKSNLMNSTSKLFSLDSRKGRDNWKKFLFEMKRSELKLRKKTEENKGQWRKQIGKLFSIFCLKTLSRCNLKHLEGCFISETEMKKFNKESFSILNKLFRENESVVQFDINSNTLALQDIVNKLDVLKFEDIDKDAPVGDPYMGRNNGNFIKKPLPLLKVSFVPKITLNVKYLSASEIDLTTVLRKSVEKLKNDNFTLKAILSSMKTFRAANGLRGLWSDFEELFYKKKLRLASSKKVQRVSPVCMFDFPGFSSRDFRSSDNFFFKILGSAIHVTFERATHTEDDVKENSPKQKIGEKRKNFEDNVAGLESTLPIVIGEDCGKTSNILSVMPPVIHRAVRDVLNRKIKSLSNKSDSISPEVCEIPTNALDANRYKHAKFTAKQSAVESRTAEYQKYFEERKKRVAEVLGNFSFKKGNKKTNLKKILGIPRISLYSLWDDCSREESRPLRLLLQQCVVWSFLMRDQKLLRQKKNRRMFQERLVAKQIKTVSVLSMASLMLENSGKLAFKKNMKSLPNSYNSTNRSVGQEKENVNLQLYQQQLFECARDMIGPLSGSQEKLLKKREEMLWKELKQIRIEKTIQRKRSKGARTFSPREKHELSLRKLMHLKGFYSDKDFNEQSLLPFKVTLSRTYQNNEFGSCMKATIGKPKRYSFVGAVTKCHQCDVEEEMKFLFEDVDGYDIKGNPILLQYSSVVDGNEGQKHESDENVSRSSYSSWHSAELKANVLWGYDGFGKHGGMKNTSNYNFSRRDKLLERQLLARVDTKKRFCRSKINGFRTSKSCSPYKSMFFDLRADKSSPKISDEIREEVTWDGRVPMDGFKIQYDSIERVWIQRDSSPPQAVQLILICEEVEKNAVESGTWNVKKNGSMRPDFLSRMKKEIK